MKLQDFAGVAIGCLGGSQPLSTPLPCGEQFGSTQHQGAQHAHSCPCSPHLQKMQKQSKRSKRKITSNDCAPFPFDKMIGRHAAVRAASGDISRQA